jgi:hypothetical protein
VQTLGTAAAGGHLRTTPVGAPRAGGRTGTAGAGSDSGIVHRPDGQRARRSHWLASRGGPPDGGLNGPDRQMRCRGPRRRHDPRRRPAGIAPRYRTARHRRTVAIHPAGADPRGPGWVAPGAARRPDDRARGGRGRVGRCRRPRRDYRDRRAAARQTGPGRPIGIHRAVRHPAGAHVDSAAQASDGVPTRRQRCPSRESSTTIPRAAIWSRRRSEAAQSRPSRAAAR